MVSTKYRNLWKEHLLHTEKPEPKKPVTFGRKNRKMKKHISSKLSKKVLKGNYVAGEFYLLSIGKKYKKGAKASKKKYHNLEGKRISVLTL